tara:strand:+ start:848 stop:3220 length:2373 start_codon:yes stop_codon:yes gene_type:complete
MDAKVDIPPEIRREIEEFTAEVERRNRGEVDENDFKRFRLQQGIYGQRQSGDFQMVRTKLPMGQITSEKLSTLADFGDKYSNGILHFTTRQDVQFHFVPLEKVPEAMELLAKGDITTREACGNTVRNVTCCHKAGLCPEESFDVTPYGKAVSKYLLRHPLTQNLARKFKISFGGCNGCGIAPIHDIGFSGVIREENGKQIRGFRVLFGGGLGSSPHSAKLLTDFIPVDQAIRLAEAVVRVFDKHGDKKNRNKARFKFVFDKLGPDKVREIYEQEFAALANIEYPSVEIPEKFVPTTSNYQPNSNFVNDPEFQNWKTRNIHAQKQDGYFNIHIKLHLGDLESDRARAIAKVASDFSVGLIRTTVNQNIMVPWVREDAMGNIYAELKKIGLHKAGTEQLKDITCCPGSETCNLGITASRGLATVLTEDLENQATDSSDLDGVSIKASGCPNSCGQHHIASIGFHGGAKKINGVLAPHYEVLLGGRVREDKVVFGTSVSKIPAKNAPQAVKILTQSYQKEKQNSESFDEFFDRKGKLFFADMLQPLKLLPSLEEKPDAYIDFGNTKKFSLEDRGQGECAGALTDMISECILGAERAIFQGKLALEKSEYDDAVAAANRAALECANGLLVTEGMDFSDPLETLDKFQALIVDSGIVSERFSGILERYKKNQINDQVIAKNRLDEAYALTEECKAAYNKMQSDKSLRIRVGGDDTSCEDNGAKAQKIDLLGVKCPFNYVKTKLKLETMTSGTTLEVLLDEGEPAENVPKSIRNDGHKVLSLNKIDGHFKLVIKKA